MRTWSINPNEWLKQKVIIIDILWREFTAYREFMWNKIVVLLRYIKVLIPEFYTSYYKNISIYSSD